MFSNKFSISCFCSSPSGTPMIWMLGHLKLPKRFLNLSSFFMLFWLNVYFFLLVQTVDLSPSFLSVTVGSLYISLYFTLHSLHFSLYFASMLYSTISVCILITSVFNCASVDRLAISSLLSSVFGALIYSFI
ncbi:hypothetical protein HJG60_011178 [Phyllostomus discolor]|uniref:Uncharacterized protein n=1 Tax=Phyllostomus discolor TaxID=89673 RepID=A0A834A207_9CHIR|nr:hypothetical protein HJG60_011178 [Phyllostomus discolor]